MTTLILLAIVAVVSFLAPGLIGAALINIAGFFVGISGMLLDLSLRYLVVDFGTYVYTPVAGAIGNTLWAAFRDISNIVIIGMFTLIAVSIILGVQSFNAKRMVAQVLIVAVLINFSLLFTRIIIEASNFVASKFYSAMALDTATNTASAGAPAGSFDELMNFASQSGISGQFINLLGLPSAFNARDTVNEVWSANAGTVGRATGISSSGGTVAIIYSVVTAALLLAVSVVLAYAVFLLIARTALLLFLLVTSSLAFGAHLIPKWGDKYWSMWWNSLLRNALFGPLLMLMLWTTMTLSYALVQGAGVRSFDKLFSDPTNGSGVLALLIFFLILAMLYGSIRFAGSFANSIAGYSELKFGLGASMALGARTTGFLGRAGIGRGAAALDRRNDERLSAARVRLANLENDKNASSLQLRMARMDVKKLAGTKEMFGGLAKSSFNAMNTNIGKNLVKTLGAGSFAGGKVDSFAARAEKQAKEAEKRSQMHALTGKEKDAVFEEQKKRLSQEKETADRQLKVAKETLEAVRAKPEHKNLQSEEKAILEKMKEISVAANEEIIAAAGDEKKIGEIRKARDGNLAQQEEKIRTVRNNIVSLEKNAVDEMKQRAETASKLEDKNVKSSIATNNANAQKEAAARYAAGELGRTNSTVANMARDLVKKAKEEKGEGQDVLKILKRELDKGKKGGGDTEKGEKSKEGGETKDGH